MAFLSTPFRPFFFVAGLLAVVGVPLWLHVFAGITMVHSHLGPIGWHSHEMLFGFSAAVIAGFLLTATAHWTGKRTVQGLPLAGLVLLWIAGRFVMWNSAKLPFAVVCGVEMSFLPLVALACGIRIVQTRNWRNLIIMALLLLFAVCDGAMLLKPKGTFTLIADPALVAFDLILILIVIIGGRIVPNFTRNATPQAAIRQNGPIDALSILSMFVVTVVDTLAPQSSWLVAITTLLAGGFNLLRMRGWGTLTTLKRPILLVLHLGYAWVGVGMILRGLSTLAPQAIPHSAALHALSVGSIGTLTLGMMSRVALGHTGRPLVFHPLITLATLLITLSTLTRILAGMLSPSMYLPLLIVSGSLWTLAFVLFVYRYTRIFFAPRADA